jgi:hypothetical protein
MWYRTARKLTRLSTRVLTSPEKTWHMTGQEYTHPIIDTDPDSPMNQIGFGENLFGAGHYTSQNPSVLEGYQDSLRNRGDRPTAREYRLPRGTKILDKDAIPADEARDLLRFLRSKQGRDWVSPDQYKDRPSVTLEDVLGDAGIDQERANHLLREFGYDAIEYAPYGHVGSEGIPEKDLKKKNVLVLNDQIINNPREFTRSRLRPDTGSTQPKNTKTDLYLRGVESGALPLSMIPASVLADPEVGPRVRRMVTEKFQNGQVTFSDLPPWAQADPSIVRFALDYEMITPHEIPYALGQDENFMHGLYEEGLVPFWAMPEALRQRPEYSDQQDTSREPFGWDETPQPKVSQPLDLSDLADLSTWR